MQADPHLDAAVTREARVPLAQAALDLDGAPGGLDGTGELHQEPVADRIDLASAGRCEESAQEAALLGQEIQGKRLVPLGEGAVSHHVGDHDGRKPALLLDHRLPRA